MTFQTGQTNWNRGSNYLERILLYFFQLAVFKGLLAFIVFSFDLNNVSNAGWLCHLWVMTEYGVVQSWTRKCAVTMHWVHDFYGCTNSGKLIIKNCWIYFNNLRLWTFLCERLLDILANQWTRCFWTISRLCIPRQ